MYTKTYRFICRKMYKRKTSTIFKWNCNGKYVFTPNGLLRTLYRSECI